MPEEARKLKIAVIGGGVAGLTATWLLNRKYDVHLFEKNNYAGGHTRTLEIENGPDTGTPIDTGFIVMNRRNYPVFTKILDQLKVETAESPMTFSFYDTEDGYSYSGNGLGGLFPAFRYCFSSRHWSLIKDLRRFARIGCRDLETNDLDDMSLGRYCELRRFSSAFLNHYLFPLAAAIWSSPIAEMREFPALPYLRFLENHGLLRLTNRPQWQYVKGGSRTYVRAMLEDLRNPPRLKAAPRAIHRDQGKIILRMPDDDELLVFDHVVIGTHADEALRLLADPTADERANLGPWRYQENTVILHTDDSLLPSSRKLRSSWNFVREPGHADTCPVSVSYYMNRLQNLRTENDYIVTLNTTRPIKETKIIDRTTLAHPLYTSQSMAVQPRLEAMNGQNNTWFCGSYFGYGFHEDAARSALEVARSFGIEL